MTERISISLDCKSIEKLDSKCKKFGLTRQEYIKFILGCPEPITVHTILMRARKEYNIGDTFTVQSLITDCNLSSTEKATLVRRIYTWINQFSDEFIVTSDKRIIRVY